MSIVKDDKNIIATSLPLPTGAATEAKQDSILAELQLKADLTETQPVSAASLPLPSGAATQVTLSDVKVLVDALTIAIRRLIDAAILPPYMDMATYRAKMTAIIESGTVTTVSTVTSMTNAVSIGGLQAQDMVIGANLSAWVLSCRERMS